eukprot:CAMPEP_0174257944 /NCGR_PEP_ID=MMETSP0439-20130205/7034_1 /TAXON_ID=0 /ORGANISM="Stereomyxa ramosa, Strain Chinc5" /LENGTH=310 /DNA_ID=CAMNT_0015341261 /DNA_START=89 /DNA_END=1018 /DNA_ORIENTATION=-
MEQHKRELGLYSSEPDCIEQQDMEIEALSAIFFDEFEWISQENRHFRLMVVPYIENTETNLVAVDLEVQYPPKYPLEVPQVSIKKKKGEISDEIISMMNTFIREEASKCVGESMIYTLIEKLKKNWLEGFNEVCYQGLESFSKLSNELVFHIFSYLDLPGLSAACLVNKYWNEMAEENSFWERMIESYFGETFELWKGKFWNEEPTKWKNHFKEIKEFHIRQLGNEFSLLAIVMEPIGLGHHSQEYESLGDTQWKEYFVRYFSKSPEFKIRFDENTNRYELVYKLQNIVIGHCAFLELEQVEKWGGGSEW